LRLGTVDYVWRWLSADPREVVDLAGAGALAAGVEERHLGDELRRWRGIVARRRLVALARRHAAVALGLAALLELLALLGAFPQWVVVAGALAYFVVALAVFAFRSPSPFELARLLDDKLGLNDRLATALEIEARGGQESPLERRTVADAAGLLAAGREDWHASPARAGRHDWSVLGGVVLALAVVVGVALATGGSSSSTPTQALGPNGGAGAPGGSGEHHRAKAEKAQKKHLAPTGKLRKLEARETDPSEQQSTKAGGYQRIPQGTKSEGKEEKGPGAKANGKGGTAGKAPTGKLHKSDGSTAGQEKHGEEKTPAGTDANTATKEHKNPKKQTIGFNLKGQKHGGNEGKGPSHISGGAGNKPRAGAGKSGGAQAGTAESKQGAQAAGGQKAGGEQGTNQKSQATPITGKASQSVKIQPGYAPSRSKKAGAEKHKTGTSQGAGGKARTAQVTGATQVGEEFSYVPAAGGAVPGPSAGLQQNYLESLKWVERLPW
jgi:hypothetical protein